MAMRPITKTISIDEARAIIDAHVRLIERRERVPLAGASGRVCAADIVSASDVPPFSRAGMDGYAVVAGDTTGATRQATRVLSLLDVVYTGQVPTTAVREGGCIEIATGAPMPPGADAVLMVEETAREGDTIAVFAPVTAGQNVGRQGADIRVGQTVLRQGELLNPSRVGALAALGFGDVEVFAKPTVAVLSTGNELVDPGGPIGPGQIYDINRFTLGAVVAEHGGVTVPFASARDTHEALDAALDACAGHDVLVFSGGSSVGERDLILDLIARRGQVLFHGIAVKPGKPTAFGLIGGTPFFGMPGYPTSCLSNAYVLLAPALRRIARLPSRPQQSLAMPLGKRITSPAGRHQFFSVRVEGGVAMPAFKASGDITSMSQADGYIEIPADVEVVEEGATVHVTLF